jgi:hypothetical protein
VLFLEYDVSESGEVALVALINAVEDDGLDPDGAHWWSWRATHDDGGMGCVGVQPEDLDAMEKATDPEVLRTIVERVILTDRRTKEKKVEEKQTP